MHSFKPAFACIILVFFVATSTRAQPFTHDDSIKGPYSATRSWWDAIHYNIKAKFNPADSSIEGTNTISYKVLSEGTQMQVDLMSPMMIDSIVQNGQALTWRQDGNAYFFDADKKTGAGLKSVRIKYHGKPRVAKNPPWDGGSVWKKDKNGNHWISLACEGMAARVWLPNKDHQADEPDSVTFCVGAPSPFISVANGKLQDFRAEGNFNFFTWKVVNPINNYNIIPYIGKYQNFRDTFAGAGGTLDLDFWVLEGNVSKARKHFGQVKTMLRCFEDWFGKFPFYEDGYKLVEAPYLGMEHQSAIAYGNNYVNGYMGRDLSNTGWGLKWDFLIIHESGHEWFGNNITAKDVADNWLHESFTAYAENLYTEYLHGKKAGAEYVIGTRTAILNNKPMIGPYNVNRDGSLDVYYKGANMLHTIRQIVANDSLWKQMLRGINQKFWHKTVESSEVEKYMSEFLKVDLEKVFDQYLRTANVPVLEYKLKDKKLSYRWSNCIKKFNMPMRIITAEKSITIEPSVKWQTITLEKEGIRFDENFYVKVEPVQ